MNISVIFQTSVPQSASPYRLMEDPDHELRWANDFLDAQKLRGLSMCSLRAYAYDLLNLAKWFRVSLVELSGLTQSLLLDYISFQLDHQPQPAARTVNHRISVTCSVYRFHHGREIPRPGHGPGAGYTIPSPFSHGKNRRVFHRIRMKVPRRIMVPLSAKEVSQFWSSFRNFRDLSLVALMLFNGLRSRETLNLKIEDLRLSQGQVLVQGKGNRQRLLPLDPKVVKLLEYYLHVERPVTQSVFVFVVLKGPNRGKPLTPAGLRTIFRHHRRMTEVWNANPHRFRHTFGADMVRAGINLPALMKLMGHSQIHTTMLYVQLAPQDIWREFHRVIETRNHPELPENL